MRYRTLAWLPIALPLAALAMLLAMGPTSARAVALRGEIELAKVLWLVAALAAARVFEEGDYLRRAWLLLGLAAGLFLVRDATLLPAWSDAGAGLEIVRGVIVAIGNVATVGGVWALARVWREAGLDDDEARSKREGRVLLLLAIAVSLGIMGPSLFHDAASLVSGNLGALPHLASDLGDTFSFILVGPLVRVALALRGGVVFWTWSLFAASQIAWMLFDGARTVAELVGSTPNGPPMVESLRVVGAGYLCAAAIAQRWVVAGRDPGGASGS